MILATWNVHISPNPTGTLTGEGAASPGAQTGAQDAVRNSGRPSTEALLGVGADWLDGLTVDEYLSGVRLT